MQTEALLAARLFLSPRLVGERLYCISNLSGRLSLYVMDAGGSVPEPLLPPGIALHTPDLLGGEPFLVFPALRIIVVVLDNNGDERYQPLAIPLAGGYPTPLFAGQLSDAQVRITDYDIDRGLLYMIAAAQDTARIDAWRGDLRTGSLTLLGSSTFDLLPAAATDDAARVALIANYTSGDSVVYERDTAGEQRVLLGTPMAARTGVEVPLTDVRAAAYLGDGTLLVRAAVFDDAGGLVRLVAGQAALEIPVVGAQHQGRGELEGFTVIGADRLLLTYNIDGCAWLYDASYDAAAQRVTLGRVLCGQGALAAGVINGVGYDPAAAAVTFSFATATSPTQLISQYDDGRTQVHTRERVLGIDAALLAAGEDASFVSQDGEYVSARLYLPAAALGFAGARPLVYYIHGGPQSQERPDFAWFSMPLIQLLTLRGFAVFVPNVPGSTGYGLAYMKKVDRDWGGRDMHDHIFAMEHVLPKDPRLDVTRAAVTGRSYGGYMTLMLASRAPQLWRAAAEMFGPYDLVTFLERIPETWKPYFALVLGDPQTDAAFLAERSPRTGIDQLVCPLLVIQGQNDPRVVEAESADLVATLRAYGRDVAYLLFDNEGHDVLKYENRVRCYDTLVEFFVQHLRPV